MQNRVVGVNQSIREIKKSNAKYVYIAEDADKEIVNELEQLCKKMNIEIKYIDSMKKLGNIFNIQVKVAAATILKGGE